MRVRMKMEKKEVLGPFYVFGRGVTKSVSEKR